MPLCLSIPSSIHYSYTEFLFSIFAFVLLSFLLFLRSHPLIRPPISRSNNLCQPSCIHFHSSFTPSFLPAFVPCFLIFLIHSVKAFSPFSYPSIHPLTQAITSRLLSFPIQHQIVSEHILIKRAVITVHQNILQPRMVAHLLQIASSTNKIKNKGNTTDSKKSYTAETHSHQQFPLC